MAKINISFHSLAAECCWAVAEPKMEQRNKSDVMILIFMKTLLLPLPTGHVVNGKNLLQGFVGCLDGQMVGRFAGIGKAITKIQIAYFDEIKIYLILNTCPSDSSICRLPIQILPMRSFLQIDDSISLHLPRPELAQPLFETIDENRAYLRTWLPWVDGTRTVEDTKTFIRESMEHNRNGTRLATFILYGERLVGSISVVQFDRDHR
jgi:hypothetical protein